MPQSSTEILSKRGAMPAPSDVERVDAAIEPRGWVLPAVLSLSVGGHGLILALAALLPSQSFAIHPVTELDFVVVDPAPAPEVPAPPPVVEPTPAPVQEARPAARPRREPAEPRPAPPPPAPILAASAGPPSTWAHPEGEAGGHLLGTVGGTGDTIGAAPVEAAPANVAREGISRAELRRRLLEYLRGTVRGYVNGRIEVPLVARREHLEGVVVVRMRLSRDGDILGVRLSRSSGHSVLDQAAVASVERIGSVPAPPSSIPWDASQELPLDVRYEIR